MQTKVIKINENNMHLMSEAAAALATGGLAAFPTETVYGLGANAFDENAVKNIFKAKGRPSDNPLIVHIYDKTQLSELAREIPDNAVKILDAFSPGPITLIFKKRSDINDTVTAGLDTVAVRIPSHPIAREFIRMCGVPVAAPSANLSGKPSPTAAKHVFEDMNGRIGYIIDGGVCEVGVESTVVDVTGEVPVILRPGGVTLEDLKKVVPETVVDPHILDMTLPNEKPKSPGMKYTHYSPDAEVTVIAGKPDAVHAKMAELVQKASFDGKRTGVIIKSAAEIKADYVLTAGETNKEYAANLFAYLREFDENNIDLVYAEFEDNDEMGLAVKNRLFKSAGNHVIYV